MLKASELIVQVAKLINEYGDREIITSVNGNTFSMEDNTTLISSGWATHEEFDDGKNPFDLNLEQFLD